AVDFVGQMRDCLPLLAERGVRVITNAGGINPAGLGRRLVALAHERGQHGLGQRGDAVVVEARGHGAEHRHLFGALAEQLAVALVLLGD
ncbi:acyclic terpene utilization AtuA family protein, partial [Citrobacter sp. AAK_AS5]